MRLRWHRFLLAAVTIGFGLCIASAGAAEARRPNLLIIYTDDIGYGDLGCQGNTEIPTPNIDSIARHGVRFTDAYATAPVCSPSRAGLVTGRYQQRFGHEFNVDFGEHDDLGLAAGERTFADDFKAAGYKTGLVGKWHLGLSEDAFPTRRGFDEFYGFLGGSHRYIRRQGLPSALFRGGENVDEQEYLTNALTREAVAFIDRHKAEPWCLYLAYNAGHTPMEAPPRYLDRVKHVTDPARKVYAAILVALDDGVGAVLKGLRNAGLENDTLIFFASDNGGRANVSNQGPFSGAKQLLSEGGIRVPMMMQWKGTAPEGATYSLPVMTLDIAATALAAAKIQRSADHPLDGVNILPHVTGKLATPPHERLFWRQWPAAAVRSGKWKLMRPPQERLTPRLYDLEADPGEKNDVAAANAQVVNQLAAALAQWESQLVQPNWDAATPKDGVVRDVTTGKRMKGKKPQEK